MSESDTVTWDASQKIIWESWLAPQNGKRLIQIREYVKSLWRDKDDLKYYRSHNDSHSGAVENNLHLLLPGHTYGSLHEEERFLLMAAAWFHDLGMIRGLVKSDANLSDDAIKESHELRTIDHIRHHMKELNLSEGEAAALADIILCHVSKRVLTECAEETLVGPQKIRTRLLAAYLRLADALHIDGSRIETLLYRLYRSDMPPSAAPNWLIPRMIPGILPDPETHSLQVEFHAPRGWIGKGRHLPLKEMVTDALEAELEMAKNTMVRGGITVYLDVKVTDREVMTFPPDVEEDIGKIVDSIHIAQYPNASRIIGMILESICQLSEGRHKGDAGEVLEQLSEYLQDRLDVDLKERDTHLGAINLTKRFLGLIQESRPSTDSDKTALIERIEASATALLKERRDTMRKIAERAAQAGIFEMNDKILVFGYSSTVLAILDELTDKKEKEIYVAECRNKTLYKRQRGGMAYNDGILYAEEISGLGFSTVWLISDASIAHYMSRNEIRKVLIGANGISIGGGNLHSVGHLMVSVLASHFGVPVYVAADSAKLETKGSQPGQPSVEAERKTIWLTEEISWRSRMEKKSINDKRPKTDVVPYDLITAFITEKGVVKPKDGNELAQFLGVRG
ncbi:MAG: hypothetical protein AB1512_10455 [Thermodesulfobacteriota bacterium]